MRTLVAVRAIAPVAAKPPLVPKGLAGVGLTAEEVQDYAESQGDPDFMPDFSQEEPFRGNRKKKKRPDDEH